MSVDASALQKVPLFSSLSGKELKKLTPLFQERSFGAGHVIAEEGQQGLSFFIIESGTATVTAHGELSEPPNRRRDRCRVATPT